MAIMTMEYAQQRSKELTTGREIGYLDAVSMADLGGCYFTLGRTEDALVLVKRASELVKDAGILMNLGLIYKELGLHSQSFHIIEESYWLNPTDPYIRLGYAEALLRKGFWRAAWPLYNGSRPTHQGAHDDLKLPPGVKEWKGEPLTPQDRVIVINEGGTGDRLSYARWLPELTKRGINWSFYPYSELYPFFERIFPKEQILKDGDPVTASYWTTTFSLPGVLNIGPTEIPEPLAFTALPEKIDKYKFSKADNLPVVGLCWSAAELFQGGRKVRSMTEGQAMRLVCMTGDKIHWVNLQYGMNMPHPVTNVVIQDWQDTAGLISNLDGVVSVDTGVMHLAGGLGVPMAVPLSGNSCWKFLDKGKQCRLYPTAHLYRNETLGLEKSIDALILDIRAGLFSK